MFSLILKRIEKTVKLQKRGLEIPILPQIDFDSIVKNGSQLFFHAYHVVPTCCGCILQSGSIQKLNTFPSLSIIERRKEKKG